MKRKYQHILTEENLYSKNWNCLDLRDYTINAY